MDRLILDHHLLRSIEGSEWIEDLAARSGTEVLCGAGFMGREPTLLEARRRELYQKYPVPGDWHGNFFRGKEDYSRWEEVSIPDLF